MSIAYTIINNMKRWGKKIYKLNNEWYIKSYKNYTVFEVFNKEENTIYYCMDTESLNKTLKDIKYI